MSLFIGSGFFSSRRFFSSRGFFSDSFLGGSFLGRSFFSGRHFFRSRSSGSCLGFFNGGARGFLGLGDLGGTLFGALLGLFARLALLQVHAGRTLLDAGSIEEAGDTVGRLRANAEPVARAVFDQLHTVGAVLGEQRVIGAYLLEILAVTRATAGGDDDAIIRTLLGAAARKPDGNGH